MDREESTPQRAGYPLKDSAPVGKLLKTFSGSIIIVFKRPLRTVRRIKAE